MQACCVELCVDSELAPFPQYFKKLASLVCYLAFNKATLGQLVFHKCTGLPLRLSELSIEFIAEKWRICNWKSFPVLYIANHIVGNSKNDISLHLFIFTVTIPMIAY